MGRVVGCGALALCLAAATATAGAAPKPPLRWSRAIHVGHNGLSGLSCPSSTLCVTGSGDGLLVSTAPAGPAASWKLVFVPPTLPHSAPQVLSVSCPSTSFCAAVTIAGDLLTSTAPAGGPGAWKLTHPHIPVGTYPHLSSPSIFCSSASLCLAIAIGSRTVLSTVNPAGGATAWRSIRLRYPLQAVTCSGRRLCLLVDDHGDVLTSTNPTGGVGTWVSRHINGAPGRPLSMTMVVCATSSYCIAGGDLGVGVATLATNPTATNPRTPGAWQDIVAEAPRAVFTSGSCRPDDFCALAASDGEVYFPTRRLRTLTRSRVARGGTQSVSCASRSWCALDGGGGNVYVGRR